LFLFFDKINRTTRGNSLLEGGGDVTDVTVTDNDGANFSQLGGGADFSQLGDSADFSLNVVDVTITMTVRTFSNLEAMPTFQF